MSRVGEDHMTAGASYFGTSAKRHHAKGPVTFRSQASDPVDNNNIGSI